MQEFLTSLSTQFSLIDLVDIALLVLVEALTFSFNRMVDELRCCFVFLAHLDLLTGFPTSILQGSSLRFCFSLRSQK